MLLIFKKKSIKFKNNATCAGLILVRKNAGANLEALLIKRTNGLQLPKVLESDKQYLEYYCRAILKVPRQRKRFSHESLIGIVAIILLLLLLLIITIIISII